PLPASGVRCLLFDAQGNVWVGSGHHGIYASVRNKRFERLAAYEGALGSGGQTVVSSLLVARDGALWVGLDAGRVGVFPADGGPAVRYRHSPDDDGSIGAGAARALFESSDGEIWVGVARGGLHRFDRAAGRFVSYRHDPANPTSISGDDARAISEDERGDL